MQPRGGGGGGGAVRTAAAAPGDKRQLSLGSSEMQARCAARRMASGLQPRTRTRMRMHMHVHMHVHMHLES